MTTIRIPAPDELANRLSGLDRLLTATKWERAAIVFAYTDVGGPHNSGREKPPAPKLNIRDFAAQGYAGLTTNKAVSRYRDAWLTAIDNGWASPVEPGENTVLPEQEFPAWPYQTGFGSGEVTVEVTDDVTAARMARGPSRPVQARVLDHLEDAARALARLADIGEQLDEETRAQLVEKLIELRQQADATLRQLRHLVTV